MRHFWIIFNHCAYSTRRKTRWLYKTKGKGQMQLQVSCLDQELSSGRQAAGIQTALLVSNPWSSDKCPTVHPFKDGLLDLDALCLLYWISSSALIHQGLLCYILKSNLGAARTILRNIWILEPKMMFTTFVISCNVQLFMDLVILRFCNFTIFF